jgi:Ca2+-binding RTX toxin-like protein
VELKLLAQFFSDRQIDMRDFSFLPASAFDNHRILYRYVTETDELFPGLIGSYSFDSTAAQWDGPSDMSDLSVLFVATGNGLSGGIFGYPVFGTVTGIVMGANSYGFYLVETALSASAIAAAAQSSSRDDDQALMRQAFAADDRITLGSADDYASGFAEDDTIWGYRGHDTLAGGTGNDALLGGFGNDKLMGNAGSDRLYGDAGRDLLTGGAGRDLLTGGAGRDLLTGGAARDLLDGGVDDVRDLFIFTTPADTPVGRNRDTIVHFTQGIDDLSVRLIDANTAQAGNQNFIFSGTTAKANAVWYRPTDGGIIVRGDVSGDKLPDFSIFVEDISSLSAQDFIL